MRKKEPNGDLSALLVHMIGKSTVTNALSQDWEVCHSDVRICHAPARQRIQGTSTVRRVLDLLGTGDPYKEELPI